MILIGSLIFIATSQILCCMLQEKNEIWKLTWFKNMEMTNIKLVQSREHFFMCMRKIDRDRVRQRQRQKEFGTKSFPSEIKLVFLLWVKACRKSCLPICSTEGKADFPMTLTISTIYWNVGTIQKCTNNRVLFYLSKILTIINYDKFSVCDNLEKEAHLGSRRNFVSIWEITKNYF